MANVPCFVLGQDTSIITSGLQYSTLRFGSLAVAGAALTSSCSKSSKTVWYGSTTADVVRGDWTTKGVVAGTLVVVVLDVVVVVVTGGLVEVLVVVVVVSMYTIIEEDVSRKRQRERGRQSEPMNSNVKKNLRNLKANNFAFNLIFNNFFYSVCVAERKFILVQVEKKTKPECMHAGLFFPPSPCVS